MVPETGSFADKSRGIADMTNRFARAKVGRLPTSQRGGGKDLCGGRDDAGGTPTSSRYLTSGIGYAGIVGVHRRRQRNARRIRLLLGRNLGRWRFTSAMPKPVPTLRAASVSQTCLRARCKFSYWSNAGIWPEFFPVGRPEGPLSLGPWLDDTTTRWTCPYRRIPTSWCASYLAQRGLEDQGDLSKFIEEAVRWRVFDQTLAEAGESSPTCRRTNWQPWPTRRPSPRARPRADRNCIAAAKARGGRLYESRDNRDWGKISESIWTFTFSMPNRADIVCMPAFHQPGMVCARVGRFP